LHLALVVLVPDLIHLELSDKVIDGIFGLSGAAIFSALKEYESGKMKAVDFSKHLTGSVHTHIMGVIEDAVSDGCIHFKNLHTTLQNVVRANL